MNNKFTEDILNEFFETGILKCSAYQLSTILNYAKKQALETKENKDEQYKWVALTKMIITYLSEIEIHLTTANENLKVGFEEYLQKVHEVTVDELPDESRKCIYEKYMYFIIENCCKKCLDILSLDTCKKCKCGDVWNRNL